MQGLRGGKALMPITLIASVIPSMTPVKKVVFVAGSLHVWFAGRASHAMLGKPHCFSKLFLVLIEKMVVNY